MALWRAKNYKPSAKVLATPYERFIAKVEKTETCWLWLASKNPKGYGSFDTTYAHRWSYEYYKRPIPVGWQIDHLCKVTSCVNPDHLEAVTLEENLRRQHGSNGIYCKVGHVKAMVNGKLRCYDCANIYKKNKRHADAKK
jgi:hypothetical protein